MKCTSQDKFSGENPVEEVLSCMQGPLFEKSFSDWTMNSIVEYFHVLPYATLIEDWFSRRGDTEFVIEKEPEAVCDDIESNKVDATKESEVSDIFERREKAALKRRYEIKAKKVAALLSHPGARGKATTRLQNRYLKGSMSGAKEPNVHSETVVALKAKNVGNEMSPCKDNYSNGEKGGFEVKSEIYTNNYIFSIQSSSILYHPFVNAGCV
jgi:phage anti-repressor protein